MLLEEELTRVCCTLDNASGSESIVTGEEAVVEGWEERWRGALSRCFARMDEMSLRTCSCGRLGSKCECHSLEVALAGSTAVVAVITPQHIVVANCGDSRAVLCRDRTTVPLSCDHKVRFRSLLFTQARSLLTDCFRSRKRRKGQLAMESEDLI